jgi:hypothetical protein
MVIIPTAEIQLRQFLAQVDDGALALAILTVVVFAGVLAILMPQFPLAAGAILLVGCIYPL